MRSVNAGGEAACDVVWSVKGVNNRSTLLNGRDTQDIAQRITDRGKLFLANTGITAATLLNAGSSGQGLHLCQKCSRKAMITKEKVMTTGWRNKLEAYTKEYIVPFQLHSALLPRRPLLPITEALTAKDDLLAKLLERYQEQVSNLESSEDLACDDLLMEAAKKVLHYQYAMEVAKVEQACYAPVDLLFSFAAGDVSAELISEIQRAAAKFSMDADIEYVLQQHQKPDGGTQPVMSPPRKRKSRVMPTTPGGKVVILGLSKPKPGSAHEPTMKPTKIDNLHYNTIIKSLRSADTQRAGRHSQLVNYARLNLTQGTDTAKALWNEMNFRLAVEVYH